MSEPNAVTATVDPPAGTDAPPSAFDTAFDAASDDGAVLVETAPGATSTTDSPTTSSTVASPTTGSTSTTVKEGGRSAGSGGSAASKRATIRTETRVIITYAPPPSPFGGANPFVTSAEEASFFDCVIFRESSGYAGAVNASSGASGLYQFLPSTWNATARVAGRQDLVGLDPASVDINNQHYLAHILFLWQGKAPWAADGCR